MSERIVVPWLTGDKFQMNPYHLALKQYGIDTEWFENASLALKDFRSHPRPLILTELLVPTGDPTDDSLTSAVEEARSDGLGFCRVGLELIRQIRSSSANGHTPIYIVDIADYDLKLERLSRQAGATNYMHLEDYDPYVLAQEIRAQLVPG